MLWLQTWLWTRCKQVHAAFAAAAAAADAVVAAGAGDAGAAALTAAADADVNVAGTAAAHSHVWTFLHAANINRTNWKSHPACNCSKEC